MKILIVEDDPKQLKYITKYVEGLGHEVITADDGIAAEGLAADTDVVITDYRLKEMNGMLLLNRLKKQGYGGEVILITAYGNTEDAVAAVKMGAYDYLNKPLNLDELEITLKRIEASRDLKETVESFEKSMKKRKLVYKSEEFSDVMKRAQRAADTDVTVLLEGESGTGKELVAEYIHQCSGRKTYPLVKVFCAAIPETLLESELFGYKKGSFTGAEEDRKGKLEYANRGTIFLDEISEIPPGIQSKLLRVIQEKEITRVGELKPRSLDIKIIAATNRDLKEAVRKGRFREDLYYRLNVYPIELPPLRKRRGDIELLTEYFLAKYNRKYNREVVLTPDEIGLMNGYGWPGNVRELENLLINTVISGRAYMLKNMEKKSIIEDEGTLDSVIKTHIEKTLKNNGGNVRKAAKILGIHRNTLLNKIKEMHIDLDFYRQKDKIKEK